MTAYKGSLVLIKIGDGATTENFTTIGGLRTSVLRINRVPVEANTVESGAFRQLLGNAGIQAMRIGGSGVFTDSAAEELFRSYASAGSKNNYQFIFANGSYYSGPFVIVAYERSGDHDDAEHYTMALESASTVTFTAA